METAGDACQEAALLRRHLDRLFPLIQEGALRGLHHGLGSLRRADVRALLDATASRCGEEESVAAFRVAGETLAYGAIVLAYTERVERLDALGDDTIADKARLRRCLYPPPSVPATAPAPGHYDAR